jgi:hypothetical protein
MERKSLFDAETLRNVEERIGAIRPDTEPLWGRMNPAQMLAHCAEIQEVWLGKKLEGTPFYVRLLGPLVKGIVVGDRPYRKNSPTHPQYRISDPRDFEAEKARLVAALRAWAQAPRHEFRHPIFGRMTVEEQGWACYRHLDHHLSQFGA